MFVGLVSAITSQSELKSVVNRSQSLCIHSLSKTESPGVRNMENDDQNTGSACRMRNISGCAMLPDSAVHFSLKFRVHLSYLLFVWCSSYQDWVYQITVWEQSVVCFNHFVAHQFLGHLIQSNTE